MMLKIKIIKTLVITTVSICFLILFQENISSQEDNLIRPGIGVGNLRLGENNEAINKIINRKFDDIKKIGPEDDFEIWLSYKSIGLTLIYNKEKILKRIMVTNKALFVENSRISVGSSIMDLRKYTEIFRNEDRIIIDVDRRTESWDYENIGIKFWISRNDQRIFAIEVKDGS